MYTIQGVSVRTLEGGIAMAMYHNGGINEVIDMPSLDGVVHVLKGLTAIIPMNAGFGVKWYEAKRVISRESIPRTLAELDRAALVVPTVIG